MEASGIRRAATAIDFGNKCVWINGRQNNASDETALLSNPDGAFCENPVRKPHSGPGIHQIGPGHHLRFGYIRKMDNQKRHQTKQFNFEAFVSELVLIKILARKLK
jgi:hypothetical protein